MDAKDVAVGVAKPGLAKIFSARDPVRGLDLRKVVLLETHATVSQLIDGGPDVVDFPRRERVLCGPYGRPLVDLEQRPAAAPIYHLRTRSRHIRVVETECPAVERFCTSDVSGRHDGHDAG